MAIEDRDELEAAAIAHMNEAFEGTFAWDNMGGADRFERDISELSDEALNYLIELDEDELTDFAQYQDDDAPDWLLDMGWYDDDGDWHNPFWYH